MVDNLVGEAIPRRSWQINEKYSVVTFLRLNTPNNLLDKFP
jgi:hypothetical protein